MGRSSSTRSASRPWIPVPAHRSRAAAERFAWKSDIPRTARACASPAAGISPSTTWPTGRDWNDHIIRFALHEGLPDDLTDFHLALDPRPRRRRHQLGAEHGDGQTYLPFSRQAAVHRCADDSGGAVPHQPSRYAGDADPTIASGDVGSTTRTARLVVHLEAVFDAGLPRCHRGPGDHHQVVLGPITFPEPVPAGGPARPGDAGATCRARQLPEDLAAVTTVTTPRSRWRAAERVRPDPLSPSRPGRPASTPSRGQYGGYLAVAKGAADGSPPVAGSWFSPRTPLAPHGVPVSRWPTRSSPRRA